jgi:hypothetical protein
MKNFTEKSLSALLQIEDDHELFEFICPSTGLMIWPLIRVRLMRVIMDAWFSPKSFSSPYNVLLSKKMAMGGLISALRNLKYSPDTDLNIIVQSTGMGGYSRRGVLHDRLTDYFVDTLPDQTLVLQDMPCQSLFSKYHHTPVLFKAPYNIFHNIYSVLRVAGSHKNIAGRIINRVADNAYRKLGFEFKENDIILLKKILSWRIAALPYVSEVWANWFCRHKFKLMLKEDACYGGGGIPIIHAARSNGILIAEYQHGAILKGHDAYNVADSLANMTAYKNTLPDFLLTYGKWWGAQTNMPVKKIAIGNPHLTESTSCQVPAVSNKRKVLVLGDGLETQAYLELARRVNDILCGSGLTVVFRPHPIERTKVRQELLPIGIQLDPNEDIYASLNESCVVISELSTGLFEAVGIVSKVLLWNTERARFAFPVIPFRSFSTIEELESILTEEDSLSRDIGAVPVCDMWEPNWRKNYLRFVEGVVCK